MGRWKRKKNRSRNGYPSDDLDGSTSSSNAFTHSDRQRITAYLTEYRDGAHRECAAVPPTESCSSSVVDYSESDPVLIAGHSFPPLNKENLVRPYLSLPETLTPKQRRVVHEICVDGKLLLCVYQCCSSPQTPHTFIPPFAYQVDIFHASADADDAGNRYIVISIHANGFHSVKGLRPARASLKYCHPWYCRRDTPDQFEDDTESDNAGIDGYLEQPPSHVVEATRKGREAIERLLDQPGMCLRDAHDTLDFEKMHDMDLSSVSHVMSECSSSWNLVDTADKMKDCVKELLESSPTEIGFDLEMYNPSKYYQVTCLIQLSSNLEKDYIIDVLAPGVWDEVGSLAPLFADPRICKVGHAIGGLDVGSLHRDFGIFVVNAFDTYEAARILRLKSHGLASVCKHYGLRNSAEYELLKENYQNSDWTQRPLTDPLLKYARTDVHYLVALRRLMMRDLTRRELWDTSGIDQKAEDYLVANALSETLRSIQQYEGDVDESFIDTQEPQGSSPESSNEADFLLSSQTNTHDPAQVCVQGKKSLFTASELRMQANLMRVITRSQQSCLRFWKSKPEPPMKCSELLDTMKRAATGELKWTNSNTMLYKELVEWRSHVAKKEDVFCDAICSLQLLVLVARKRPTDESSLRRIRYFLPPLLEENKDYREQMLSIVVASTRNEADGALSFTSFQRNRESIIPGIKSGNKWRFILTGFLAAIATASVASVLTRRRR